MGFHQETALPPAGTWFCQYFLLAFQHSLNFFLQISTLAAAKTHVAKKKETLEEEETFIIKLGQFQSHFKNV